VALRLDPHRSLAGLAAAAVALGGAALLAGPLGPHAESRPAVGFLIFLAPVAIDDTIDVCLSVSCFARCTFLSTSISLGAIHRRPANQHFIFDCSR
jgi:hypothetical protein